MGRGRMKVVRGYKGGMKGMKGVERWWEGSRAELEKGV